MPADREMPKYRCHKVVHALKIKMVMITTDPDGSGVFIPEDDDHSPVKVDSAWMARWREAEAKNIADPDPGYYVVYEGGYKSWSPTKAFEGGYTRID